VIGVLVVDDQALVRAGFRMLVDSEEDMSVIGEAGGGEQAVAMVGELRPDVVLMDIRMPDGDGVQATRQITADPRLTGTRVIVLTTFDVDEFVMDALRAGASGFLLKDTAPSELLRGIRTVTDGGALLAPTVTRRLIEHYATRPAAPYRARDLHVLTEREREVMALVAAGLSNSQIADRLVISPDTARTHVSRVMTKLDARDRAQVVVLAYERGLVAPGHTEL